MLVEIVAPFQPFVGADIGQFRVGVSDDSFEKLIVVICWVFTKHLSDSVESVFYFFDFWTVVPGIFMLGCSLFGYWYGMICRCVKSLNDITLQCIDFL